MSNAYDAAKKQMHTKLDLLYKEMQAMFLRHGDEGAHVDAKMIMPELQVVLNRLKRIAHPEQSNDVSHD